MIFTNVLPAWVLAIPYPASEAERLNYLHNQAKKDGMPEHVRLALIKQMKKDYPAL